MRQRKDSPVLWGYSWCMDRSLPQLHQSVYEVLDNWPETARAFRSLKTACFGCYLARFCTLVDVAAAYLLPIETVMDEMQNATRDSKTLTRSER